jgi:toxin-antitoxin system PIN domain toxin
VILPDTNLLIYAHNQDDPRRDKAARWWSECLSGAEPIVLCSATTFAFVRITTSARLFSNPMSVSQAVTHVMRWFEQPIVQFAEVQYDDIQQALDFLREAGTAGNLTTDAQIAALALRLGATVHSADADYARFPGVRWFNPITAKSRK